VTLPGARGDVAAGRDAAARMLGLAERPTAVFCGNDLIALGMLQGLFAAGVAVPADVAIVGYDDAEVAAAAVVPLSSIRRPATKVGKAAAELLVEESGAACAPRAGVPAGAGGAGVQPDVGADHSGRPGGSGALGSKPGQLSTGRRGYLGKRGSSAARVQRQ
jgi:Periplasmic binding protein-like domain